MKYCFRKAQAGETDIVYSMIVDRIHWMDEKGIQQWNKTDYLQHYPLTYYQKNIDCLFVLADQESGRIVCAALLFDRDPRWNADEPAFYIHNFVSAIDSHHEGTVFIRMAEQYAVQQEKRYLRLDSADDNARLAEYYEALGFNPCGTCHDGSYSGILRQKELTDSIKTKRKI